MKTVAFTLSMLAASAAAFQTVQPAKSSTALLNSKFDGTFGTGPETGNKVPPYGAWIFDNIGERGIKWFQTAEIKNGRVAMVATIGYMIQKWGIHFPLYLGPSGSNGFSPESSDSWYLSASEGITFSDVAHAATPLDAIGMIPLFGFYQILFVAGWFELLAAGRQESDIPGNFGYDPLGFTKRPGGFDSAEITSLRMKEIKNGRLAMMTMTAWVTEDLVPGSFPLPHP
ncbi:Fucoxanthin chlorophyll a c [Seminavis robusta]|uniref:Fucoxanthin chlorophyll a c n=1 Tax=Seminavis robusta TaxID=568900 RepID=A0A9N8DCE7_9STRA|nr:Fucoxanthin chlorophyll a c [Seminavis robusta]|eukprot:Sro15_g011030.1 Fucoxanthin chlorophyll a c (228) ;mRNA; f:54442-55323